MPLLRLLGRKIVSQRPQYMCMHPHGCDKPYLLCKESTQRLWHSRVQQHGGGAIATTHGACTLTSGHMMAHSVHRKGSCRSGMRMSCSSRARQLSGAAARNRRSLARLESASTVTARAQTLTASMPSAHFWYRINTGGSSDCALFITCS